MLDYIQLAVISVGILSLAVGLSRPTQQAFDKIINIATGFLCCHALHALLAGTFFPDQRYLDSAAPYGLIYGPLLFFALRFNRGKRLSTTKLLLHCLPWILGTLSFLVLVIFPELRETYLWLHLRILYILLPLSFFGYSSWAYFRSSARSNLKQDQKLITMASMILIVMTALFLTIRFTKAEVNLLDFAVPVIYLIMLMATCLLLNYNSSKLKLNPVNTIASLGGETIPAQGTSPTKPYGKSAVGVEALETYGQSLRQLLEEEKLFLDPDLNLTMIAGRLKISKHHLTQVVNQQFDKNFNQLINSFRIDYACKLMKEDENDLSLEEIAFRSGFSSRVSFYRNFKVAKNMSPTEFKENINSSATRSLFVP